MEKGTKQGHRFGWIARRAIPSIMVLTLSCATVMTGVARAQVRPSASFSLQAARQHLVSAILKAQVQQALTAQHINGAHKSESASMIPLEIESTRDVSAAVRSLGGTVKADIAGKVIAASVPADRVNALAVQPGVQSLMPVRKLHSMLDVSVPEIRADQAWNLTNASGLKEQGAHVLVGIVDSGIDYHNADFKNPDGSTRIKYIWDQSQDGNPPSGFSSGYECDSASINSGQCPEKDTDSHGTHVSGIAAGNGRSSNPARDIGVAPQADIIVVKCDLRTDNVLAAWAYLVSKAQQLHEPIAINNSFGGQYGPHDGVDPEDQAIDILSQTPGHVFVVSAGNDGHRGVHGDATVQQGGTATLDYTTSGGSDHTGIDLYYWYTDSLSVSLQNRDTGETFGPVPLGQKIDDQTSQDGDTHVQIINDGFDATHNEAWISIHSASHNNLSSKWRVIVNGAKVSSHGRFDAWTDSSNGSFDQPDESDTIGIPADADYAITVGSYTVRTDWTGSDNQQHTICDINLCLNNSAPIGQIRATSSVGPSSDGWHQPSISAPGAMILSSLSHDAPVCQDQQTSGCVDPAMISPDGTKLADSGTSMAAPHVTGTAALMLEANPTLSAYVLRSLIEGTARHDSFTGSGWSPAYGYGKLDALASVKAALAWHQPFTIRAVKVEAYNSSANLSRQSLSKVPLKTKYYVSVYLQYAKNLPNNVKQTVKYTVGWEGASTATTWTQNYTLSHATYAGKIYRFRYTLTSSTPARFDFWATVTVGSQWDVGKTVYSAG